MTLCYLFWHWPERTAGYESALVTFHEQLRAQGVEGLIATASYRVEGLPWLPNSRGYEDWYVVDGFADLEALNTAAVSAEVRPAHDLAAHASAAGLGGLYGLHSGGVPLNARELRWIAKERGTPYPDFYAGLPPTTGLLRRQMVLGPGLEFCAAGDLPGALVEIRERLV